MTRSFLLLFFIPLLVQSCFVADAIFLEPREDTESLQIRSEQAVSNYLFAEYYQDYISYGFSGITIYKPKQIVVRDSLVRDYNRAPSEKLEGQINSLNDSIKKYNIERSLSLSHFYLVENDSDTFEVFEGVFTLSDTLTVKSFKPTLYKKLKDNKRSILYDFFYEQSIFLTQSFSESSKMSKNFYAFYKSKMESYQLMRDKSNFLEHCLLITELVKKIGDYNPHEIAKQLVKSKLRSEYGSENYLPAQWSILNEVSSEEKGLQGYYFFHKFTTLDAVAGDTLVKAFEFNPYLEVTSVTIMDQPYQQYFE